jgi:hypothetical protein
MNIVMRGVTGIENPIDFRPQSKNLDIINLFDLIDLIHEIRKETGIIDASIFDIEKGNDTLYFLYTNNTEDTDNTDKEISIEETKAALESLKTHIKGKTNPTSESIQLPREKELQQLRTHLNEEEKTAREYGWGCSLVAIGLILGIYFLANGVTHNKGKENDSKNKADELNKKCPEYTTNNYRIDDFGQEYWDSIGTEKDKEMWEKCLMEQRKTLKIDDDYYNGSIKCSDPSNHWDEEKCNTYERIACRSEGHFNPGVVVPADKVSDCNTKAGFLKQEIKAKESADNGIIRAVFAAVGLVASGSIALACCCRASAKDSLPLFQVSRDKRGDPQEGLQYPLLVHTHAGT